MFDKETPRFGLLVIVVFVGVLVVSGLWGQPFPGPHLDLAFADTVNESVAPAANAPDTPAEPAVEPPPEPASSPD